DYFGTSRPVGSGVPPGFEIPIRLLVAPPPVGTVNVKTLTSRVDLVAPEGTNPTGTLSFRNNGSSTFTGVLVSDVEFIVPQAGLVAIPSGATVDLTVMSDRSKRPDAALLNGTQVGRVSLVS